MISGLFRAATDMCKKVVSGDFGLKVSLLGVFILNPWPRVLHRVRLSTVGASGFWVIGVGFQGLSVGVCFEG